MIARCWQGFTTAADADAYLEYLHQTGLAEYRSTPGNTGVLALRRLQDDRAHFLLVSFWETHDAIRMFAGDDVERAVYYPEDERFLIERDEHVTHFDVVHRSLDAES